MAATTVPTVSSVLDSHLDSLTATLPEFRAAAARLSDWGGQLALTLADGGRLLVAGNGGSAAEAQHLAAELVGKLHADRPALSALALPAESSSVTAISNDYGYQEVFARQVQAHGRPGDVLLLMSTSGRSGNLIAAADAAAQRDLRVLALTGRAPNPLAGRSADAVAVPSDDAQVVQELHLVCVHVLCEHIERDLPLVDRPDGAATMATVARGGA